MPEMSDPLGRPTVVTGPEYMDALSRLGYNVETMSSSLPMYTKAANAATSLMDQAFNNRLAWDKAQADNKEVIARANNYDSITDYNNRSLDLRIKALDQENQQRALGLQYDTDTLKNREDMLGFQTQIEKNKAAISNATIQGATDLAKLQQLDDLDKTKQNISDRLAAQSDLTPALDELHQIPVDDPNWDNKYLAWHQRHLNAINNEATKAKIAAEVADVMTQHNSLASVKLMAGNRTEVQRLLAGGHLPGNDNYDGRPGQPGILQDPERIQRALVQGHMSEELEKIQGMYTRIKALGGTLPAQYQREWREILLAGDGIMGNQNEQGYADIIKGGGAGILTADGHLRPNIQSAMQDIERYFAEVARQQAAAKAPSESIEYGGITGGTRESPVVKIQNIPPGTENLYSQYGVNPEARTMNVDEFAQAHPELRPLVDAYKANPTPENKAKLGAAIQQARGYQYGGRVGYQTGGSVGDPATTEATKFYLGAGPDFLGTGSTDTVPAMLTPGEFVLNKAATTTIGPENLDAINKIGADTSAGLRTLPGSPLPADATVAAFSGLAEPKAQIEHPDLIKTPELTMPLAQAKPTPESDTGAQRTLSVGRLPMSNVNNYAYPEGAVDLNGIDRNVWANVMSEEGPEYNMDGKHLSVFGLWKDAPGLEGQAFSIIKQHGSNSLPAYEAVTNAWNKLFLGKTQPQRLTSPGMQEMVIADSQHAGGGPTLKIIQQMGGWDAINKMDPADAIRTYSALRSHLWPGNSARVDREREWALTHDSTLSGETAPQIAGMNRGGMVEGNPLYGPGLGFQDGGYVPQPGVNFQRGGEVGGGFESELEGGGGRTRGGAGGGFEAGLDQPGAGQQGPRHRRFHPRAAGMGGMGAQPNIPDPMQKKLAKLSQDFVGGLSSLIRSRPELGGAIMQHAKNLMASTGLGDVRTGAEASQGMFGGGIERQQQPLGMNPAMLAMSGLGGEQSSSSEEAYT